MLLCVLGFVWDCLHSLKVTFFHAADDILVVAKFNLDEVVVILDDLKLFLFIFEDTDDIDNLLGWFDHEFEVVLREGERVGLADDFPEGGLEGGYGFPVDIEIDFNLFVFSLFIFHFTLSFIS